MRYQTLMNKIDEGDAEVAAWQERGDDTYAAVTTYDREGRGITRVMKITGMPK